MMSESVTCGQAEVVGRSGIPAEYYRGPARNFVTKVTFGNFGGGADVQQLSQVVAEGYTTFAARSTLWYNRQPWRPPDVTSHGHRSAAAE